MGDKAIYCQGLEVKLSLLVMNSNVILTTMSLSFVDWMMLLVGALSANEQATESRPNH